MQNFPTAIAVDPSANDSPAATPEPVPAAPLPPGSIRADLLVIARSLRQRAYNPAVALGVSVGAGLIAASVPCLILEALFAIHWWTALVYMSVFFVVGVWTYRRLSPEGARFAVRGTRRYLEDSGTLDLVDAARELARTAR
ncbi:hypothetical protein AADG42_15510 [Ammonicoccus fulvus]|uniref:Uncharacterized protein n=1 Tax=Ammonicoccus fulvus TaxID=3138240 RepID=A0ABZ3FRD7_9ACTN